MSSMSERVGSNRKSPSIWRHIWSARKRRSIWKILAAAAFGLGVMAAITYLLVGIVAASSGKTPILDPFPHPQFQHILTSMVPVAVLLGAGAVGGIGLLRQMILEAAHGLDLKRHDAETVSRLRERYSTAAGQLGHEAVALRLAGVYSLAALADDWIARDDRDEAQVCIDLLCAYQRVPRQASDVKEINRAEVEVRQTITRVVTAHIKDQSHPASWCGMDFDFTGAIFAGDHSFAGAQFPSGRVNFKSAEFTGGEVDFTNAAFTGSEVNLSDARFRGTKTSFTRAQFTKGSVNFTNAHFTGGTVDFSKAGFTGSAVSFSWATFSADHVYFGATFAGDGNTKNGGANFAGAKFVRGKVVFAGAVLFGHKTSFSAAQFTGAKVSFGGAEFTGSRTPTPQSEYRRGYFSFEHAGFTSGEVDFTGASFTGGEMSFIGARFEIPVPGPWRPDHPPSTWPPEGSYDYDFTG